MFIRRRMLPVWQGGLIVFLVFLAYLPALRGGFIWDDDAYVTQNPTLHDLGGLRRIWFEVGAVPQYYPMVHTTFWLEYHLWGLNPVGYHLINVLLHAIAAILLWQVLLRLQVRGAWLAAVLFALHPVLCRIGGLDHRTQERVVGRLLLRCRTGLSAFCRVGGTRWSEPSPMVLVSRGFGSVHSSTIKQNGDLFAAGGVVAGGLVEEGPLCNGVKFCRYCLSLCLAWDWG